MTCAMCVRDDVAVRLCRWPGKYVLLCLVCRLRIKEAIARWIDDRKAEIETRGRRAA